MSRFSSARRRAYRSRHQKKVGWTGRLIITVLICGLAVFAAAIMLGNYLHSLSDDEPYPDETLPATEPETEAGDTDPEQMIIGRGVSFMSVLYPETSADTSASGEGYGTQTAEYNAVSVLLRDWGEHGVRVHYSSPVIQAQEAAYTSSDTSGTQTVNIRDGIAALRITTGKSYVSGVFTVCFHRFEGERRNTERDLEIALIYELFEYGINDVILCGFDASEEDLAAASEFMADVEARVGEKCCLGLALPFEFYSGKDVLSAMRSLDIGSGFLAMDLFTVQVPGLMTPEQVVFDRVRRVLSILVSYNIRVVVGCGGGADPEPQVSEALRGGAISVQGLITFADTSFPEKQ